MSRGSRHNPRLPPWHEPRPVELDERYEREVQRSTSKLERLYARAEKRARQAEERLSRVKQEPQREERCRLIAELEAALELRMAELEEYRRMMVSVPASAEHRGRKSFRPVPNVRP
jgi:hypothetical protein